MPPVLALFLALSLAFVLIVRESRRHDHVSRAVWIPLIWLLILGSRSVAQWLNLEIPQSVDAILEGSPLDRLVFTVLIASALVVVVRRRAALASIVRSNPWLLVLFAYGAVSFLWSDFPFVAFKRWSKSLGDPLMALVLLSEPRPAAALATVLRRCAYLLLPLSIVFIKYYPALGRTYDPWSGTAVHTGVTTNKNLLGYLLFVFGLYFISTLLTKDTSSPTRTRRVEAAVTVLFLVMIGWLFRLADSQTPLVALFVGTAVVFGAGTRTGRARFGVLTIAMIIVVGALQLLFNLDDLVLGILGRESTLTGRTDIWRAVIALAPNPWVGAGFESFWLGDRLQHMWAMYPVFRPNQAHNGYVEVYLNLGWVGLGVCAGVLTASYRTMRDRLADAAAPGPAGVDDLVLAKFGLGFLAAFVLYNVTEAVFQPLNFLFVIFMMIGVRYPLPGGAARTASARDPDHAAIDIAAPARPRAARRRLLSTARLRSPSPVSGSRLRWETKRL